MSGFVFSTSEDKDLTGIRKPTTEYSSRQLMLAGERGDTVEIKEYENHFNRSGAAPDRLSIIQRCNTYYGPKLRLVDETGAEYLLTAPGPDADLYLWTEKGAEDGFREGWEKQAEVKAALSEDQKGYHLCPTCREPLKSAEHERLATLGNCPNA